MFSNYLKIAFRTLRRNKSFTFINIFGLSLGIATCMLILLYVQHELSYDRFNKKADRIVRVVFRGSVQDEKLNEAHVMPPTAETLKAEYPEVQDATRLRVGGRPRISYDDKSFKDDDFAYVDPNFFQVFTLPFIRGDAGTALLEPHTVVISQALATKYFGSEDPIGKVLSIKDWNDAFKVSGVFEKVPDNAHFHFDLFASMSGFPGARSQSWMESEFFTYLVLPKGYDYKQLEAKLPQVVEKYMGPQMQQSMGQSLAEFRSKGNDLGFFLQPLTDIHLHSDFAYDLAPAGNIQYVYIFSAIALFMLFIACINFMNLSTAGASKRSREVGIRKVLGSAKLELVRQFLMESALLTAFALLVALWFVQMALPGFNHLTGLSLRLNFVADPLLLPGLLGLGLITSVLAGLYPAFALSSFNPMSVLKGRLASGKKGIGLRSGLVVFQFGISIMLMVGTTVVYKQLAYIQNKKLGYDKNQVLVLPESSMLGKNEETFRRQLLQDPRVLSVSTSGYLPAGPSYNNNFFLYAEDHATQVKTLRYDVDYNYVPTLGMQMAAGRNFSKEFGTDSSGIILNETAAKAFGWGENALGHVVSNVHNDGGNVSYRVIGVVKDFHFKSLHEHISPLVMVLGNSSGAVIVKVKTADISGLTGAIKKEWEALVPGEPFEYSFLDDRFNKTYQAEQKVGLILGIFAGLTIFVACLGLFGLAMFTAEQRRKEIGIRKVLGATVAGIAGLLAKDFLKLVGIAIVFAAPFAYYFMQKWLDDFAYRIDIQWWMFVAAAAAAIIVAVFTIGFQSVWAALANPVKSLRNE